MASGKFRYSNATWGRKASLVPKPGLVQFPAEEWQRSSGRNCVECRVHPTLELRSVVHAAREASPDRWQAPAADGGRHPAIRTFLSNSFERVVIMVSAKCGGRINSNNTRRT
jgi:hypothetical protein